MIFFNQGMLLLGSNHFLRVKIVVKFEVSDVASSEILIGFHLGSALIDWVDQKTLNNNNCNHGNKMQPQFCKHQNVQFFGERSYLDVRLLHFLRLPSDICNRRPWNNC